MKSNVAKKKKLKAQKNKKKLPSSKESEEGENDPTIIVIPMDLTFDIQRRLDPN